METLNDPEQFWANNPVPTQNNPKLPETITPEQFDFLLCFLHKINNEITRTLSGSCPGLNTGFYEILTNELPNSVGYKVPSL